MSQAHFRTGISAIEADDGALIHLDSYFRTDDVGQLFSQLDGTKDGDQILTGDSPMVLPAARATPTGGSPTLTQADGHPVFLFDGRAEESVSFVEFVPASWERYDVQLWWTRLSGDRGSGDVAWQLSHRYQSGAPSVGDLEDSPVASDALPAFPSIARTTLAGGLTESGALLTLRVTRVAADQRDTAPGSAALYALVLRRS
jgi:hypothetical protein